MCVTAIYFSAHRWSFSPRDWTNSQFDAAKRLANAVLDITFRIYVALKNLSRREIEIIDIYRVRNTKLGAYERQSCLYLIMCKEIKAEETLGSGLAFFASGIGIRTAN